MGDVTVVPFIVVSVLLISFGLVGLARMRNGVRLTLAILTMSQGAVLALAVLARYGYPAVVNSATRVFPLTGMVMAIAVTIGAALFATAATALLLLMQRRHGNIDIDDIDSGGGR